MSVDRWEFKYSLPHPTGGSLVELSAEEAERILLKNLREAKGDAKDELWELARFYSQTKQQEKALEFLHKVMALHRDMEHKAACVLAMGQTMEQVGDYASAVRYYREAFALEPLNTQTWYFINNNLGFSLNTLGNFVEGERFCRSAIKIDRQRPNAFKNLGIALRGQGKVEEAAKCFINATQADASDARALKLLEELLEQHPEFELSAELDCCREAVRVAHERRQALQPVIHRGFRKKVILIRARIVSCLKRWWS